MDINKIIFSRTAPEKKVSIVKELTTSELLNIPVVAVVKMVKTEGRRLYKSRDKELLISRPFRTGNNWNSEFDGISICKDKPLVCFYVQYSNTDTNTNVPLDSFLNTGDYRGYILRSDEYGNVRPYYFTYSESEKAECLRSLILEYLNCRYKGKLSQK